jgi:hypothetical protein
MTDEEKLRFLELKRKRSQMMHAPAVDPDTPNPMVQGARATAATAGMAIPKLAATVADIVGAASRDDRGGYGYSRGPRALKPNAPHQDPGSRVQEALQFREQLAGQPIDESGPLGFVDAGVAGAAFPGSKAFNVAASLAGHGGAKAAESGGYGTGGQVAGAVAANAPLIAAMIAGKRLFGPSAQSRQISKEIAKMTPEQISQMMKNTELGARGGLDLMAWQAAPKGTGLRALGEQSAVVFPHQNRIQSTLQAQRPKAVQATVARIAPEMDQIAGNRVAPTIVKQIHDDIRHLIPARNLHPKSAGAAYVDSTAKKLGAPFKAGTVPAFRSDTRTIGQLESISQDLSAAVPGLDLTPQKALAQEIKRAMQNRIPEYAAAKKSYGAAKEVVKQTADDVERLAGKNVDLVTKVRPEVSGAIAQIGGLPYRARRIYSAAKSGLVGPRYDKMLSMDAKALMKALDEEMKRRARTQGGTVAATGYQAIDSQDSKDR